MVIDPQRELTRLVIGWSCVGVLATTALLMLASLIGMVKFASARLRLALFGVLILEAVIAGAGLFDGMMTLRSAEVAQRIVGPSEQRILELERNLQEKEKAMGEKEKHAVWLKNELDSMNYLLDLNTKALVKKEKELDEIKKEISARELPDGPEISQIEQMKTDLAQAEKELAEAKQEVEVLNAKVKKQAEGLQKRKR